MKSQDFFAAASQRQFSPEVLSMPGLMQETRQQEQAERVLFDSYARRPPQPSEIRAMQRQRGAEPCFCTDKRYSCAEQCEWRKDCLKLRAEWLR